MSGAIIQVTGVSNIKRDLQKLTGIVDTEIDAALMSAGMIVEGSAKENCPVDTGNLRSSITTHAGESDDANSRTVCVGTNVEYAPYVEYGTYKMAAQPYLRPALDDNREKVIREVAYQLLKAFARKGYV